MKKLLLVFCILGMWKISLAQWTASGNDIYNTNAGNVGIGTTAPGAVLHVRSNSSGLLKLTRIGATAANWNFIHGDGGGLGHLYIQNDNGSTPITLQSDGSVGIGTASPAATLHVKGNDGGSISMQNTASVFSGIRSDLAWYNSDVSTVASIRANAHTDNVGTSLSFFTRPISGSLSESLRINHDGTVGIGTTAPAVTLHVKGDDGGSISMQNTAFVSSGSRGDLAWYNSELSTVASVRAIAHTDNVGTSVAFYTRPVAGALTESMRINHEGNVGIGTTTPDSKLTVAGKIHSQEVKITATAGADFVFEEDYKLRSLAETESFIKQNKHLPEIASAKDMVKNGIELGEMNVKLLQKIEELTLHLIELNKTVEQQRLEMINHMSKHK